MLKTSLILSIASCAILLACNNIRNEQQSPVSVIIDSETTFQTIQNFGASGCWYAEPIGKHWPLEKKEKMAQMLFSTDTLEDGSPAGIGLTAWRFNIGAGTAEQGDSSGIRDVHHMVECFLDKQGHYNWEEQAGYQWFLKQAKAYDVPDLIAFVNSPPVFFTKNGLGYKTTKGSSTNLKQKHFSDFSLFLTNVIHHFDSIGLHFNYLSPVNEPQWEWTSEYGNAKQEGSPYENEEIYQLIKSLNSHFNEWNIKETRLVVTEAAKLDFLTDTAGVSSNQIEKFWNPKSDLYLGNFNHVAPIIAGHGYFTDTPEEAMINYRAKIPPKTKPYNINFWQSEYCLLGDGYKEGKENPSSFDCGMFLAKIIHHDLTKANASAWHFWNSFEPGSFEKNTRYYLFGIDPNEDFTDGEFKATGNLFALGHFSRFIRPNMQRVAVKTDQLEKDLLISAYQDPKTQKQVVVIINYSDSEQHLRLTSDSQQYRIYETTQEHQLQHTGTTNTKQITLSKRGIYTLVST